MRNSIVLLLIFFSCEAFSTEYEIFHTGQAIDSKSRQIAKIYDISQGDREVNRLNSLFSQRGIRREEIAASFINEDFKTALKNQMRAITKAASYQLAYFPALVIDQKYVIYGSINIQDYLQGGYSK